MKTRMTITVTSQPGINVRHTRGRVVEEMTKAGLNVESITFEEGNDPEVMRLPTGTVEKRILESDVEALVSEFPTLDVLAELEAMRVWLEANPMQRRLNGIMFTWIRHQFARHVAGRRGFTPHSKGDV